MRSGCIAHGSSARVRCFCFLRDVNFGASLIRYEDNASSGSAHFGPFWPNSAHSGRPKVTFHEISKYIKRIATKLSTKLLRIVGVVRASTAMCVLDKQLIIIIKNQRKSAPPAALRAAGGADFR